MAAPEPAERTHVSWQADELWLDGIGNGGTSDATEAMQQIGTNAIPILLRMLKSKEDSRYKLWLIQLVQKQHVIDFKWRTAQTRHSEAMYAFGDLGSQAKSAMPILLQIYNERRPGPITIQQPLPTFSAAWAGGSRCCPAARPRHHEHQPSLRFSAVLTLGQIQANPALTVPALTASLRDQNAGVRIVAVRGLAAFGSDAKSSVLN